VSGEGHGWFLARWGWFLSQSTVNLRCNVFFYESQTFPTLVCLKMASFVVLCVFFYCYSSCFVTLAFNFILWVIALFSHLLK
jgi:hypothetical protein